MELMALYGYCWNVGDAKKYISIERIVKILDGKNDTNMNKNDDEGFHNSGRYQWKPEHEEIFRIKTR